MTAPAVLDPGKCPFTVGKPAKTIYINHVHFSSHLNERLLTETARQHGVGRRKEPPIVEGRGLPSLFVGDRGRTPSAGGAGNTVCFDDVARQSPIRRTSTPPRATKAPLQAPGLAALLRV